MNKDLDSEIAEKVFGWEFIPISSDAKGENNCEILYHPKKKITQEELNTLPLIGKIHKGELTPHYSSDYYELIDFAREVGYPLAHVPKIEFEKNGNIEKMAKIVLNFWKEKNNINPHQKYTFCNHHHELTDNHQVVNFGNGPFVANKDGIPMLKALNEIGLKTRSHHIEKGCQDRDWETT